MIHIVHDNVPTFLCSLRSKAYSILRFVCEAQLMGLILRRLRCNVVRITLVTSSVLATFQTGPGAKAWAPKLRRQQGQIRLQNHHQFHSTTRLSLNRFLFDPIELDSASSFSWPTVTIPKDDYRTVHAAKILGLHNGDTVRAGVVIDPDDDDNNNKENKCSQQYAGLITDTATVQWIPEGKVKKAQPLGNGDPPGSLQITLHDLHAPPAVSPTPPISLILALPRPLQLNRLLPMICQMGVDHLVLTHAQKVPRDYFGSHLFRHPNRLRERLVEGLCQASVDVRLPRVTVVKNLRHFLHDDLDRLFPLTTHARVMAHPERVVVPGSHVTVPVVGRFDDNVQFPLSANRRVVLAVGPEGGWAEPEELDLLTQTFHFQTVTLGPRVLRSDVAVVALMALAHEACRCDSE